MKDIRDNTLETRLEAFVDHIDSIIEPTEEGGYAYSGSDEMIRSVGGNAIFNRQYLTPDHISYHELSLSTLRKLARFLTDAIIRPSAAVATSVDHFQYWAWTAAVASEVLEKDGENLKVSDFQYTVHTALLPIRLPFSTNHPWMAALSSDSERLELLSGLTVLEGFICHFGESLTPDGTARKLITQRWKPKQEGSYLVIGNGQPVHKYHDILQIWCQEDAGDQVSQVLSEINNINRYDMDSLKWKFEDSVDLIDEEINDGTNNFLRIVGKHRDFNLHGQISTRTLAPVVLNLCCLYIWDMIEQSTYDEEREEVIRSIQWNNQTPGGHPLWPSAFYPVKV